MSERCFSIDRPLVIIWSAGSACLIWGAP